MKTNESQIVNALRHLDPSRWDEVLDFIGFLQQRAATQSTTASIRTAHDLLQSEVVGVWADRTDIGNSLTFARQLRQQAEHRSGETTDVA
jgi:hypothetical protein